MGTEPGEAAPELLTVDQLAERTGLSVRTARYYAGLGLLPAPARRGRMAFYGPLHVARLELIRSLQQHGLTLAAIERRLAEIPLGATPDELAVHRALLTAWRPRGWDEVAREELDARAGRPLTQQDLQWLTEVGAVRRRGEDGRFQVLPLLREAVELHDAGVPGEAVTDADAAVRRHMAQLADELIALLRVRVLSRGLTAEELEPVLANLRALTLDAIVNAFQHAAAGLASKALGPPR